jgi:hypothetical protein
LGVDAMCIRDEQECESDPDGDAHGAVAYQTTRAACDSRALGIPSTDGPVAGPRGRR